MKKITTQTQYKLISDFIANVNDELQLINNKFVCLRDIVYEMWEAFNPNTNKDIKAMQKEIKKIDKKIEKCYTKERIKNARQK